MDMDTDWDKMKKATYYFHKLSLTQQILSIIFIIVLTFILFFFFVLGTTIDNTISKQMYNMLANNQRPIQAMIEDDYSTNESLYSYFTDGGIQTNCFVVDGSLKVIGNHELVVEKSLADELITASNHVSESNPTLFGNVNSDDNIYYYLISNCSTKYGSIILVSFMDSTYPAQFRNTIVNSTVYVTILIFMILFMILIVWVFSIIRPLNQIKDYIEMINDGKEVDLNLVRGDEIGEVAEAIVNMKEELTKQEKAKEEMIHNISHDLKTPIATIKSYGESIKDGIYPYGDLESSVDVIIDNAERLEKKVYNLLYLNRIEYLLASDAEGVVTNMREVVEEVVLNSAVIRPEIQVITEVDEVFFDGLLESWRVCIENIMDNAFRYAVSYIKIEVHENELIISNDGQKMDESRIKSLFRPFEKGEKGKFGLGLSIVAKVTKANNYLVEGYNTEDGVAFKIYRKPVEVKKVKQNRLTKQKKNKE